MVLSSLFLIIAFLYSLVGFGGGSSYIAILAVFDIPYQHIPIIALLSNFIVVSSGSFFFVKRKHFSWNLFWPFIVGSVPMAFIGGRVPVSKDFFFILLGISLLLVSIKLLVIDQFLKQVKRSPSATAAPSRRTALFIGALLGLLSGIVGIGGGIFLAPILLLLRWGTPKQIAATSSLFILVNSISGLVGQAMKTGFAVSYIAYWQLFAAVLIGGQIGSRFASGALVPQNYVKTGTSILVFAVATRLLWSALFRSQI